MLVKREGKPDKYIPVVIMITTKEVAAGEELNSDYGDKYFWEKAPVER